MSGANWWVDSFPASVPGGTVYGGGGYGSTDMLTARDPLDAKRMAEGFAPGASYPDGYLGQVTDRREDRMAVLQARAPSKSYQRGVHKGEIVGPQAYFWDADMDPMMGIERQAAVVPADVEGGLVLMTPRFAPTGNPVEMIAHDAKLSTLPMREQEQAAKAQGVDTAVNPLTVTDPSRAARMRRDLPRWSGVFQA